MGYCTNYTLTIEPRNYPEEVLFEQTSYYGALEDFINKEVCGIKWFEHEDDLICISKKYPDLLFVLEGVGEEHPDIWKKYFKNGKSVRYSATISFPKFNESDLE